MGWQQGTARHVPRVDRCSRPLTSVCTLLMITDLPAAVLMGGAWHLPVAPDRVQRPGCGGRVLVRRRRTRRRVGRRACCLQDVRHGNMLAGNMFTPVLVSGPHHPHSLRSLPGTARRSTRTWATTSRSGTPSLSRVAPASLSASSSRPGVCLVAILRCTVAPALADWASLCAHAVPHSRPRAA